MLDSLFRWLANHSDSFAVDEDRSTRGRWVIGKSGRAPKVERLGVETSGGGTLNDEAGCFGESGRKAGRRSGRGLVRGANTIKSEQSTRM